jgi:hypothetical protein
MKSKFKTLDEFYKAIDNVIEKLKMGNCSNDANRLNDLLHNTTWTTSSELLGELQLALKDMKGKYKEGLGKDINECHLFSVHHRKFLGLD